MKWLAIAIALMVLPTIRPALAQDPAGGAAAGTVAISPGEITPTPEMWFYEQYLRQYQDPKVAIRQRAELKAAQRQQRMAARKWFGFSNSRPTAGPDPYFGDYSPHWSSNNGRYPFQWNGVGSPILVLRSGIGGIY